MSEIKIDIERVKSTLETKKINTRKILYYGTANKRSNRKINQ